MNSRANIIKPSKDGSFSPLQRAWQAVARRFTIGRDAVKPNFGSTESGGEMAEEPLVYALLGTHGKYESNQDRAKAIIKRLRAKK